ncbi:MAG TPA: BON domain-containing protein [Gemmatimonadaceae bacterium]|nr:BON domain-containing protein [Gemmatimonadaceae bacterium]
MARDYEDIHDLDDLSDGELRELVRQHLAADNALDIDEITITVNDGKVLLDGEVGTDEERRIAEHVVTDLVGIDRYENRLFVHGARRGLNSEAADESLADEDLREGLLLGDRPVGLSPEAEHKSEDLDADLFGTTDVQHAIQDGTAWIPPESPTPEGPAEGGELGEEH